MTQAHEGLQPRGTNRLSVPLVVAFVVGAGLASILALAVMQSQVVAPHEITSVTALWVLALYAGLAALSDVIYVPVRHGDAYEELTFVEVVLIWGALLLPPVTALVAALVGFALVAVIMRRPLVKSLFNLGSYALAGAALIATYDLLVGDAERFSAISVIALLLGALLFVLINLAMLTLILTAAESVPAAELWRDQWILSLIMAVGSVGVATVALALLQTSPALVPFAALPAVALWYAYRSSAQHAQAQQRNRWLVQLGQAVASPGDRDTVIPQAADALRRVYGADDVIVAFGRSVVYHPADGLVWTPPRLTTSDRVVRLGADDLPPGWTSGVAVRMEHPQESGILALGATVTPSWTAKYLPWVRPVWDLSETDGPGFVALTAAVASAIRSSDTLSALTAETAKLSAVVDNATDGICVVDAGGTIRLWSPSAARITGVSVRTAMSGRDGLVASVLEVPPGPDGRDLEIERADGQTVTWQVTAVQLSGADPVRILTIRDMTRERRAERLKSDFIATVSHELRTPITPIRGYADLLARRWDRMSEAKRAEILATIRDRADHLARLVDDLLLASRASEGTQLSVEMAPVELNAIVAESVAGFVEEDTRLRVAFSDEPLGIVADRTRVVQIVNNMLSNALKYSPKDQPVDVRTEVMATSVAVTVTDYGRGIPADELDRIFGRFYRIEDPMTMTTGGSGLGLFIARELARTMGGELDVGSEPGAGATFRLQFPRAGESDD